MGERLAAALRYGVPLAAVLAGLVVALAGGVSDEAVETGAVIAAVGVAVGLWGALHRLTAGGGDATRREEAALRYFDEHGHWPEERELRARRAGRG